MLAVNQERLQRALDSVSIGEPPRIELTLGEATMPSNGLAVLDSSFNPPTRAHLHMIDAATKTFGMGRSLLLLAKHPARAHAAARAAAARHRLGAGGECVAGRRAAVGPA